MKRILATALAMLMLLGVFAVGAGAVTYNDLTAEQKAQYDDIGRWFTRYWDSKHFTTYVFLAAEINVVNAPALIDGGKLEEFLVKVRAAENAAQETAAWTELNTFPKNEEATIAAFLAGTLKADLEAKVDAYWAEIINRYQPLIDAYLKPEFLAFIESYRIYFELGWALEFFGLVNRPKAEEIANGPYMEIINASDHKMIDQLAKEGKWTEAKARFDALNPKLRKLLIDEGVIAADTYTVTYNANGGSGAPAGQTKVEFVPLTLSTAVPARTGYIFSGWATSATGAAAYQPGGDYAANAAATLYAVWEQVQVTPATYTVTYDANGGAGAPAAQTKTEGVTLALNTGVPTWDGYSFKGWATSATGAAAYQPGGDYAANAAATLYAVWEEKQTGPATYAVSFNANGGTGAPDAQTKTEGVTLALSTAVPARAGYAFKGWATGATGTAVYQPGANYTADAAAALYAIWEELPAPQYFWSDWGGLMQFVLRFVLFGWLWMRWVQPIN